MAVLELRRTEKPLPAGGSGFWLGDCRVVVAHPNSYLGTLYGRFVCDKKGVFIEFQRGADAGARGQFHTFFDVRQSEYVEAGRYTFEALTRICHRKALRQENEKLWKQRAEELHVMEQCLDMARVGTFELAQKNEQTSDFEFVRLSDAQCAAFVQSRFERLRRTAPVDLTRITDVLRRIYELFYLPMPCVVLKSSPREAAAAAHRVIGVGSLNAVFREVCFGADAPKYGATLVGPDPFPDQIRQEDRVRRALSQGGAVPGWSHASSDSNHALSVLAGKFRTEHAHLWQELFDECVACWLHETVCVICDFPAEVHFDDEWRLHNESGPALRWRDEEKLYSLRGVRVDDKFIEALDTVSPGEVLEIFNTEVRRVVIERYGIERLLNEMNAQAVQEDSTGVLYSIPLNLDEPLTIVKVRNSTPEPDGTHKFYYLRVPPQTRTAREGVAWSFDMPELLYEPKVET